jgi:hypothetical protein
MQQQLTRLKATVRDLQARVLDQGFLYVVLEPTHRCTETYKVGRTSALDLRTRLAAYEKGTELIHSRKCTDVVAKERQLLKYLRRASGMQHCNWVGYEYFRCEPRAETTAAALLVRAVDDVVRPDDSHTTALMLKRRQRQLPRHSKRMSSGS